MNGAVPACIWVDADACPTVIKEILYRAAERSGLTVTLVANQPLECSAYPQPQDAAGFGRLPTWRTTISAREGGDPITAGGPSGRGGHRQGCRRPQPARRTVFRGFHPRHPQHA
ncbi:MAG: hypothetical protein U1F35_03110 [Steroidobacteraceae bacterium]